MTQTKAVPVVRDRNTAYLYVVIAIAALGGLLFGYDTGVAGGAIGFLGEADSLSVLVQGILVSAVLVGGAIGALIAGPMADRLGRKPMIVASGAVFSIGAILSAAAGGLWYLGVARVILGLGVGAVSVLIPVYIAELAPARMRGMLVSMFQLLITVGIVVSYVVNAAAADSLAWRWSLGLAAVPGILLALGALTLPESPRYLVRRGREQDAAAVLERLRGHRALAELEEIKAVAPGEGEKVPARELLLPKVRPLLFIGMMMALFAQIAGINAVIYYAPQIMETAGFGDSTLWWATIGLGLVNVALTVVGMLLVDRMGRKPLLIIGAVGMTLSLGVLAVVGAAGSGAITFICLSVYVISYAVGPGMLAFVVISEIFPLRYRGIGTGLALLVNYLANIVVAVTFLPMLDGLGASTTFGIYAVICLAFVAFAVFVLPETKGRSLEEIEADALGARVGLSQDRTLEVSGL